MDDKTDTKQKQARDRAAHDAAQDAAQDGDHHRHHDQPAGIDLPVFGHVPYKSIGFAAGLGIAGAVGAIEWPVVAAVGIGYALARR